MALLTKEQIQNYHQDGYLVIENYLSNEEIDVLNTNAQKLIDEFKMSDVKIFSTDNQSNVLDNYFLESAYKSSCFFEENAFDKNGQLVLDKSVAINKIGHAMHDLEPDCEKIAYKKSLYEIMLSVGASQPVIVQSQYIFKQPNIGAKVNPHIDSTFIYTEPMTCVAAWIAMQDATEENGCLNVIPGSHLSYPIQERYIKNEDGMSTSFTKTAHERVDWDLDQLQPLPVKKGSLVLLHGELVHASKANISDKSRHAFVLHIVDQSATWAGDNWLQRPEELPFKSMHEGVEKVNNS